MLNSHSSSLRSGNAHSSRPSGSSCRGPWQQLWGSGCLCLVLFDSHSLPEVGTTVHLILQVRKPGRRQVYYLSLTQTARSGRSSTGGPASGGQDAQSHTDASLPPWRQALPRAGSSQVAVCTANVEGFVPGHSPPGTVAVCTQMKCHLLLFHCWGEKQNLFGNVVILHFYS